MYDDFVTEPLRAIGYARVSTEEQALSGASLPVQRAAIVEEVDRRDWRLVGFHADGGESAATLHRPGVQAALEALAGRQADALVVAKLDRLSRSLLDFVNVMELSRRQGWKLIALDLGVDSTTPAGEAMANVMATFAQLERRLIGQRTKEALAAKRADGVRLGRPPVILDYETGWIMRRRDGDGMTFQAIADQLNSAGRPTAAGGKQWYPSTVHSVYRRGKRKEAIGDHGAASPS
jgi:DNA invertase Pin-like site-specific DNA recombinase